MLIDTHAHLNFSAFKNDAEGVIRRALDNDIWMINVGSQYTTSKRAVDLAEKYPRGVYAAIGLHPIHLETDLVKMKNDSEEIEIKTKEEGFDYKKYQELAKAEKVVAIGEAGLDYYWRPKTTKKKELFKQKQKDLLLKQLELAKDLNLPVIFHCRMAHQDLIEIFNFQLSSEPKASSARDEAKLQRTSIFNCRANQRRARREMRQSFSELRGVIHCFTGTWKQAEKYLKMGFYLGFNGIIFKLDLDEVIKKTPLEKILIETDCPYLTPPQVEGRNEPLYVKYIAEKIAQIKGLSYQKISEITTENAIRLFKLDE